MSNSKIKRVGGRRYVAMPIEAHRSPYRWEVVDRDRSAKIVARCGSKESADSIAKQLNEKGFVEEI